MNGIAMKQWWWVSLALCIGAVALVKTAGAEGHTHESPTYLCVGHWGMMFGEGPSGEREGPALPGPMLARRGCRVSNLPSLLGGEFVAAFHRPDAGLGALVQRLAVAPSRTEMARALARYGWVESGASAMAAAKRTDLPMGIYEGSRSDLQVVTVDDPGSPGVLVMLFKRSWR